MFILRDKCRVDNCFGSPKGFRDVSADNSQAEVLIVILNLIPLQMSAITIALVWRRQPEENGAITPSGTRDKNPRQIRPENSALYIYDPLNYI